jgi:hypothetical protein
MRRLVAAALTAVVLVAGTASAQPSPAQAVHQYYAFINAHNFPGAWGLLSPGRQAGLDYNTWVDGHRDTLSVQTAKASPVAASGGAATVAVTILAVDATSPGTITKTFEGTWSMVLVGGSWKLDAPSLALVREEPSGPVVPQQPFEPFVGDWGAHGFYLGISPDGRGIARWRVYEWCGPLVPPPCDQLSGNIIISGGEAYISFTRPDRSTGSSRTLAGMVEGTTDPDRLRLGPVVLQLQAYGTAELQQDAQAVRTLCGPRFGEAPDWFKATFPCGA